MITPLTHALKRALEINGRPFVITLSPTALKITIKGKRNGLQLEWTDLVSGDAALAVALNASVRALPAPRSPEPTRLPDKRPAARSKKKSAPLRSRRHGNSK